MIINIQAPDDLQRSLVEIVALLNTSQPNYVSTLDFLKNGILSPAAGIARLKRKGVIIETVYQTMIDSSGRVRKKIACYRLVGVAVL